jgi:hypothetical protein
VLFASGKTLCFGAGASGRLGSGDVTNVAGSTGPQLLSHPTITFSSASARFFAVSASSGAHTCHVRCDGRVFCFGANSAGQLGLGAAPSSLGGAPGDMVALQPIPFSAVAVPVLAPGCAALASSVAETSGILSSSFSAFKTVYLLALTASTPTWTVTSAAVSPAGATATLNGEPLGTLFVPSSYVDLKV